MTVTAPQHYEVATGSEGNVAVGFQDLPSGVLLTGTPTIVEVTTTDLTLTSKTVNVSAVVIKGESYITGTAVLFHRAGGSAGVEYTVRITVSTNSSPADVLVKDVTFSVVS